jgi:hypothetical protein
MNGVVWSLGKLKIGLVGFVGLFGKGECMYVCDDSIGDGQLGPFATGEAFAGFKGHAVQIVNVLPAKNIVDSDNLPTTPYQLCYSRKPRVRNFRTCGCPTYFKRYAPQQ